jgi:hypothetical protein
VQEVVFYMNMMLRLVAVVFCGLSLGSSSLRAFEEYSDESAVQKDEDLWAPASRSYTSLELENETETIVVKSKDEDFAEVVTEPEVQSSDNDVIPEVVSTVNEDEEPAQEAVHNTVESTVQDCEPCDSDTGCEVCPVEDDEDKNREVSEQIYCDEESEEDDSCCSEPCAFVTEE